MCLNGQICHQQIGIDNLQDYIAGNLSVDPSVFSEVRMSEEKNNCTTTTITLNSSSSRCYVNLFTYAELFSSYFLFKVVFIFALA